MSLARIQVAGQQLMVPAGIPLHQALLQNGVYVETPCGARGTCRKCRVKLTGAVPPPCAADREHLTEEELALGFRLSCQHRTPMGILGVAILPESVADPQKAAMGRISGTIAVEPWAPLHLAPARGAPSGRALGEGGRAAGLAPGEGGRAAGLAIDIGTTTVVAALLDLQTGEELAAASLPNPQGMHGADLMARLTYAIQDPSHPHELQLLVRRAVNELIDRLLRRTRLQPESVVAATVCGNTVMHHMFLGLELEGLAAAPYTPAVTAGQETPARELGLNLHPQAPVYTLPNVAGFVGADALAAGLAAGIDQAGRPVALVDIGTNGECLLRAGGRIFACSAPAGPAFEGGELYMGMRANPGAVEAVSWQPGAADLEVGVIRGAPARGICGSGLLDAAAVMLAAGAMDGWGRLRPQGPLGHRFCTGPWGEGFELVPAGNGVERPVVLTQKDIRQLQLAKGAIRSGVEVLLRVAGLQPADLEAVLLAGAFGNYLRRESAVAIGLLPQVPPDRVRPVGNAAAQGAKLVLLSAAERRRAEQLGARIEHVDLATHPDFEAVFMEALNF